MADFTCDTNYLSPTRFKVVISRRNYPNLQFFANSVQHPSMDMTPPDVGYRRTSVAVPADTVDFGQLTLDIMLDEKMRVYEEMYNWMLRLVNEKVKPNTGKLYADAKEDPASYNDMTISIYNSSNNPIRRIQYVNALPVTLGDINFTATSDDQFITFPCTFKFDYFKFA